MRIYDSELYAFGLGAFLSWAATYLHCTKEKRTLASVRSSISDIGNENDLSSHETKQLLSDLSDGEIKDIYAWAEAAAKRLYSRKPKIKIGVSIVAAEALICEEALGLTRVHAIRALMRTKCLNNLKYDLRDVVSELQDDDRFPVDREKWKRFASRSPSRPQVRVPMATH